MTYLHFYETDNCFLAITDSKGIKKEECITFQFNPREPIVMFDIMKDNPDIIYCSVRDDGGSYYDYDVNRSQSGYLGTSSGDEPSTSSEWLLKESFAGSFLLFERRWEDKVIAGIFLDEQLLFEIEWYPSGSPSEDLFIFRLFDNSDILFEEERWL